MKHFDYFVRCKMSVILLDVKQASCRYYISLLYVGLNAAIKGKLAPKHFKTSPSFPS